MTMASGAFGLTFEKMFLDTAGVSLEAETHKALLVQDAYTPDFNAHDFRNDVTNESSGTGYTTGGKTITTTEVTVSAGFLNWDFDNITWNTASVTARGLIPYFNVGATTTDMLVAASTFGADYTSTAGDFSVSLDAAGFLRLDIIP